MIHGRRAALTCMAHAGYARLLEVAMPVKFPVLAWSWSVFVTAMACSAGPNDNHGSNAGSAKVLALTIKPGSASLLVNDTVDFACDITIEGHGSTEVDWAVAEGDAGGAIKPWGGISIATYTAPDVAGTYHVVATSQADPSESRTATVTVRFAVGGVFHSTNNGDSWTQPTRGMSNFGALALTQSPNGDLWLGTGASGSLYRSVDHVSWKSVPLGYKTPGGIQVLAIESDGTIWAGTESHGVFVSLDGGANWSDVSAGLPSDYNLPLPSVERIVVDPKGRVYLGTTPRLIQDAYAGVFRSTDRGATWIAVNSGLPRGDASSVTDLVYDPANGLCGVADGASYCSADYGDTWHLLLDASTAGATALKIAVGPSGELFVATANGLLRSRNHGQSWDRLNPGWTNAIAVSLGFADAAHLFAAARGSAERVLLRSLDGGDSWDSRPLPIAVTVMDLMVADDGSLFIATWP
jgi:photosystem II stability/assembly factor-like uncharacterized protein